MDAIVNKKFIAIIPARGGSKRIPHKNIIDLNGKPMIAWSIEAALKSKYISEVLVSTDDKEIAKIAIDYGAKAPFLRDENADDYSPISSATIRSLQQWKNHGGSDFDIVIQLMANCPLRTAEDIDKAIENFILKGNKFQISCFKYGWMNPWWAHKIDDNGKGHPLFEEKQRMKRSQDLPDLYCPTGAIWIASISELFKSNTFYGEGYSFLSMPWVNAIDIDDYEDLEMAKYFSKK
jgi:N-acylneuraminate cytidylyltransferase